MLDVCLRTIISINPKAKRIVICGAFPIRRGKSKGYINAHITEPREIYLVPATKIRKNSARIRPTFQLVIKIVTAATTTPLPPLNL